MLRRVRLPAARFTVLHNAPTAYPLIQLSLISSAYVRSSPLPLIVGLKGSSAIQSFLPPWFHFVVFSGPSKSSLASTPFLNHVLLRNCKDSFILQTIASCFYNLETKWVLLLSSCLFQGFSQNNTSILPVNLNLQDWCPHLWFWGQPEFLWL